MAQPFVGEIKTFSFGYAPRGYAECQGQLLPINQNQALFALLGTFYGGNGTTTFALPDLRGHAAVHAGQSSGTSPYVVGQTAGTESVSLTPATIPSHTHGFAASNNLGTSGDPTTGVPAKPNVSARLQTLYGTASDSSLEVVNPAGGANPHDNRQPYLTLIYAIALVGIFPSRN